MELQNGDWVRAETGDIGQIVVISRASAFIEMMAEGKSPAIVSYLISQLTKIDAPLQQVGAADIQKYESHAHYLCPACGYQLSFSPRGRTVETEAMCPCCGIHFGHDDRMGGNPEGAYMNWRASWILNGMRWWGKPPIPPDFNPDRQLARLIESMQNE